MTGNIDLVNSFHKAADYLGIGDRIKSEVQLLASRFTNVDLEGLGLFESNIPSFDEQTNQLIKANWETRTRLIPSLFPGAIASIENLVLNDDTLKFALRRSRFDIYDGLKQKMPLRLNIAEKPLDLGLCLPLSMGAVTVTAPDKNNPNGNIVFGIRSASTSFGKGGATCLPSGYFDPDADRLQLGDPPSTRKLISIRLTVLKELIEEMNIQDYRRFEYLGLVYDGHMAKGVLIAVRLGIDITVAKLRKVIANTNNEIQRYHFVANDPEAVKEFISKYPLPPHDAAKLALHFASTV